MASVICETSIKRKQQGLGAHIIGMVEVLIGAVLQDVCRHLQHCHHSAGRERWILLGCGLIILELQVRPGLEQLIKEAVKMVKKCDPVMEVALRAAHARASKLYHANQTLFAEPAVPFRISRKKFPTRRQGLLWACAAQCPQKRVSVQAAVPAAHILYSVRPSPRLGEALNFAGGPHHFHGLPHFHLTHCDLRTACISSAWPQNTQTCCCVCEP